MKETSGCHVSDLDDVEFCWENDQLEAHAVFRPGIDTPLSPSFSNDFEMASMAEKLILVDEEQGKENSCPPPPFPTTPASERPTLPLVLMRSCPFGTRIENVPNYVYRHWFEYFIKLLL